ncbi:NADH pyrophosphatase [anaerobic digester metagenome]
MKRETIYKRYEPSFTPKEKNSPSYWFVFNSDKLLINTENDFKIPFTENLNDFSLSPLREQYLGTLEGHPCYTAEVAPGTTAPNDMAFEDLRSIYEVLDEDIYLLAGRAIQVINWDKNHQFCGKCGAPTLTSEHEMSKVCPECGFTSFTRLSPAVITAIVKDDKILLAKHSYGLKRYSLIAGFLEAGETLEEGVKREIAEEVGLKVKNIEYFGSQPWPFPHSLMVGFTAEYESGEIKVDGNEITDAKWFSPDEVPRMSSMISIASELIEWFVENY